MNVFAPGKLVLTGAYAVLHGAPAIVVATSRGATADTARVAPSPTPEVRAALGDAGAPHVDASPMFAFGRKLGLGASAAILVASVAARDVERGADLASPDVRALLFARARRAHAEAQGGGSGVDVAASVYGGVLRYTMDVVPTRAAMPPGLRLTVFACPTSARTADLRAEVARLAAAEPTVHNARISELAAIADDAARAVDRGDGEAFVAALRRTLASLALLGDAARVGIVPDGFLALAADAEREGAAFCVSGAGGGDVAVFAGSAAPSQSFVDRAKALGLFLLPLDLDEKGARVVSRPPVTAPLSAAPLRS